MCISQIFSLWCDMQHACAGATCISCSLAHTFLATSTDWCASKMMISPAMLGLNHKYFIWRMKVVPNLIAKRFKLTSHVCHTSRHDTVLMKSSLVWISSGTLLYSLLSVWHGLIFKGTILNWTLFKHPDVLQLWKLIIILINHLWMVRKGK